MEDNLLDLMKVHIYLLENGGKVRNRDVVRYFKSYLTDPVTKDENRARFKSYINTLATTKTEGDDKIILLKPKYSSSDSPLSVAISTNLYSPKYDPRNSVGIPLSPSEINLMDYSPSRQPPPYRPPPPPPQGTPSSSSLDAMSIGSITSLNEQPKTPQAPPREKKRDSDSRSINEITPKKSVSELESTTEDKTVSVKERTQKFNRLASVEDELSPRQPKSAEKKNRGADEDDGVSLTPLEPKKCMEWYVTASRGDYQELIKLANTEPRLVNKKDPFTAYTVLHWGAKYGNPDIIKIFAGRYNVDVNGKTNGGYTPLHISAQFGHKDVFKLLIEVYKADPNIRDYSGRTADYYFFVKEQKEGQGVTMRKIKGRKKQSDKDLGFLRIGSLNVRVKKTTEAFSNFLGVGSGSVTPADSVNEKVLKGWGSADNVNKEAMAAPKSYGSKKKYKKGFESGGSSTPSTPKTPTKNFGSFRYDSDSDTAAGFDSNWKH